MCSLQNIAWRGQRLIITILMGPDSNLMREESMMVGVDALELDGCGLASVFTATLEWHPDLPALRRFQEKLNI